MYERKLIPIDELGLKVIGISLHLAAVVQKRLCLNTVHPPSCLVLRDSHVRMVWLKSVGLAV